MLKRYHHIIGGTFRIIDACVIGCVWLVSYWLRFYVPLIEVKKGFPPFEKYAALSPLVMILWMAVFSSMRVYQSRRILRRTHEVHLILKSHAFAILLFIALTYLFSEYKYSRAVVLYFGILGGFSLVCFRLLLRSTLRSLRRKGFNLRNVLLVGEGKSIETLVARLDKFPELGLKVVGAITHESSPAKQIAGKAVIGHFDQISKILHTPQQLTIDQILIALPRHQYIDLDRILGSLKDETVSIQLIPDIHEYVTLGCEVEDFDGLPIVNLNDSPLNGWGAMAKRVTDIALSTTALIIFAPLMGLITIIIKFTSPGTIFYQQERMGLDGQTFKMIKFRSMHVNSEQSTGAVWAKPSDNRRTVVGAFLRATSLDELPQLWNVLRGEMSLVGPRPERPIFVKQFRNEIPHYMLRHKVKAGMTGWAQVNGWRGNTSLDRRIECDLYYIRNWSFILDLKIMAMTVWKGFLNRNAY